MPQKPPRRMRERVRRLRERFVFNREMRLRLASAAILIPLVFATTWAHEITFAAVVLLTGALVLYEWLRMIGAGHLTHLYALGWALLGVIALVAYTQPVGIAIAVAVGAAVLSAIAAWRNRIDISVRWVLAGMLYLSLAMVALIALRKGTHGFGVVIFVFLIAWASDTAAFFVGRKLGGPKLWPKVSPSKTWSGALGGLVAGVVFGGAVAQWLSVPLSIWTLAAAALIAVAAQLGDLLESAAKRNFAVKDAGTLIPGHGGVMDRVDGMVAAGLFTACLGAIITLDAPASGFLQLMGR